MAYVVVLLSAAAGAAFGQSYKWKVALGLRTVPVTVWFSLLSSGMLAAVVLTLPSVLVTRSMIYTAAGYASAMAVAMHSFYRVIENAKLGVSWTMIQLSVIVPFLAGVIFYDERLTVLAALGVAAVVVSILLFGRSRERTGAPGSHPSLGSVLYLTIATVATGITATTLRIFKSFSTNDAAIPTFLLMASLFLLAINSVIYFISSRLRTVSSGDPAGYRLWERRLILFSIYKCVTNVTAIGLLMLALQRLPGYFVFPVRNTLSILLVYILSTTIFRERLNGSEVAGAIAAIVGIAALSIATA